MKTIESFEDLNEVIGGYAPAMGCPCTTTIFSDGTVASDDEDCM